VPAYDGEPEPAAIFVERLLTWLGTRSVGFTNMVRRTDGSGAGFGVFTVPHWVDEGLVIVGMGRVGLLWFLGTD
jgi:hypothetical protein